MSFLFMLCFLFFSGVVISPYESSVGSEIYQETLSKALSKHFGARLLIVDSLSMPGVCFLRH